MYCKYELKKFEPKEFQNIFRSSVFIYIIHKIISGFITIHKNGIVWLYLSAKYIKRSARF